MLFFSEGSGIGKPVADEEKFKIDPRSREPHKKEVYQDEDRTRRIQNIGAYS